MTEPIYDSEPQAGYYKTRRVRGGPWLPVVIWWHEGERDEAGDLQEDEGYRCEIDGERVSAYLRWISVAGRPIDEATFRRLSQLRDWADNHAPNDPYATPGKPIDLNRAAPIF